MIYVVLAFNPGRGGLKGSVERSLSMILGVLIKN
jgi:hypothetical protein